MRLVDLAYFVAEHDDHPLARLRELLLVTWRWADVVLCCAEGRGSVAFPAPTPDPPRFETASIIFTAIQEQLGLKLESTRAPVDFLEIDHIERPAAD
jgi:uncharacterized protein (TIGR03435 family)